MSEGGRPLPPSAFLTPAAPFETGAVFSINTLTSFLRFLSNMV